MEAMKKSPGRRDAYLALGLIVLTWLILDFNSRMSHLRRITTEKELVGVHMVNVMGTQSALETQIVEANSDTVAEKFGYVDAHMVKEGEIPIILIPGNQATPQPTPRPVVVEEETNHLQNWIRLFLDPESP
jgi:hypothetical protein